MQDRIKRDRQRMRGKERKIQEKKSIGFRWRRKTASTYPWSCRLSSFLTDRRTREDQVVAKSKHTHTHTLDRSKHSTRRLVAPNKISDDCKSSNHRTTHSLSHTYTHTLNNNSITVHKSWKQSFFRGENQVRGACPVVKMFSRRFVRCPSRGNGREHVHRCREPEQHWRGQTTHQSTI